MCSEYKNIGTFPDLILKSDSFVPKASCTLLASYNSLGIFHCQLGIGILWLFCFYHITSELVAMEFSALALVDKQKDEQ